MYKIQSRATRAEKEQKIMATLGFIGGYCAKKNIAVSVGSSTRIPLS
jgi:hypothetical protein